MIAARAALRFGTVLLACLCVGDRAQAADPPVQVHGSADTLRRFRPCLMLELTEEHLARAGDRLDDAFAFLNGLDYAALEFAPGRGLIPVATHHDGDFWFIPCEDSAA